MGNALGIQHILVIVLKEINGTLLKYRKVSLCDPTSDKVVSKNCAIFKYCFK